VQARERFDEWMGLINQGVRSVREYLADRQRQDDAAKAAEQADAARLAAAAEAKARYSLGALLTAYWKHLEKAGKQSAGDVQNLLTNHVIKAFPDVSAKPASEIRPSDLRRVLAKLIEEDKGRTAGKLRSYVRAAFGVAIRSENDPTAPSMLHGFGVESNPADALPSLTQFTRRGERTLNADELRLFMERVAKLPGPQIRAALQLALLLGGQRPQQLLRVTAADLDLEASTVVLRDGKGARRQARLHVLPLTDQTKAMFSDLLALNAAAPSIFSTDRETIPRPSGRFRQRW
jgi:integrase